MMSLDNGLDKYKSSVSVITACLNCCAGIEKTIQSVLSQTCRNIEYIIIDGGSTDGTVEIIRKYQSKIKIWISEKDEGISDAFNKGVKNAKGDFIGFLNAGDYYLHPESITSLVEQSAGVDIVYGGIRYQRNYKPEVTPRKIENVNDWVKGSIPHQASLTSRKVFERMGSFNVKRQYCMDYELFYRAWLSGFKFMVVPALITSVNCEGVSARLWKDQLDEFFLIQKELGASAIHSVFHYYKRFMKMWAYHTLKRFQLIK